MAVRVCDQKGIFTGVRISGGTMALSDGAEPDSLSSCSWRAYPEGVSAPAPLLGCQTAARRYCAGQSFVEDQSPAPDALSRAS